MESNKLGGPVPGNNYGNSYTLNNQERRKDVDESAGMDGAAQMRVPSMTERIEGELMLIERRAFELRRMRDILSRHPEFEELRELMQLTNRL